MIAAGLRPHLRPLLLLLVATLVVYGRLLGHDFLMNWDDNTYVTANGSVHGFSAENLRTVFTSFYAGNYAPVQMLSYMLDYTFWGLWPGGYLLTNIILHGMNGLLVYWLLFRFHGERLLATVAAGVFLCHPVQVESVAWISQRKNLLAMCFMLVAWLLYCRFREAGNGRRRLLYAASLASFLLSLLAKPAAVFFPLSLLLYEVLFPAGEGGGRLRRLAPFFLVAGVAALVAMHSQSPDVAGWSGIDHGGRRSWHGGSPWATFLTMIPVLCTYLRLLLWPAGLSAIYDPPLHVSPDGTVLGCAALLLLLSFLAWRLYLFDRRLGYWPLFSLLALLPVSQAVPLITLMNDRYLYFPLIGVAALAGAAAVRLRDARGGRFTPYASALALLLVLLLSAASFQRAGVWRNSRTLWSDAAAKTPARFDVWEGLGEAYHLSPPAEPDRALQAYGRAFAIYSSSPNNLYNLATLHGSMGNLAREETLLRRLLRLMPEHVMGWSALGDLQMKRYRYREAENALKRAEILQPEALQVKKQLGRLYLITGAQSRSREYLRTVEREGGGDGETAFMLACIEADAGRRGDAILWLETALQRGYSDLARLKMEKMLRPIMHEAAYEELMKQYSP